MFDGLSRPEAYVKKAAEQGLKALAITDKGTMHSAIEFYKACKKHDIKPILGCEVYIAFNKLTDKRHQIDNKRTNCVLIAKDNEGYENLLKMATVAYLDGYYYKPRVDWELMKKHSKGLIALSGNMYADIPQAILNGDDDKAKEMIQKFQDTFGKENFYFELIDHSTIPQQKLVNEGLKKLAKEHDVPLVATGDVHYVNREDNVAQDIMVCIQTARDLADTNRISFMNADYSMKDPQEYVDAFKDVPEAIENTKKIADECNVTFEFDTPLIPKFPVPDGKTEAEYLKELCYEGLVQKYKLDRENVQLKDGKVVAKSGDTEKLLAERLNFEIGVIENMGFIGYFLIVWDFVKWAKDHGVIVGPGRGSAAGAIVAYTLDITTIDPIKYSLLFERFLNPERVSMPDIDLDFADTRRDEVIDYVADKYGRDQVAQICTFGTLAARAAVKDVGRTMGVSFADMNAFAKLIPERPGTTLEEALEQSPELRDAIEDNETYKQVYDNALKLEGAVRHVSVHACAVVIADDPLTKYTALQNAPKDDNIIITQYNAKPLEALGLLKMDFLGLKNLTILETAIKIIERTKGVKVNMQEIPIDDKKTYALLSRGETTGVFQLESAGMKRYLKDLRPTEFEDIIAMVSLYRPGPMEWIPDYIAGKHGNKTVNYPHESLEPILNKTYGIAIYQEQILQIAQVFAGFTLGQADLLRRAIGKKIAEELAAQREKFIKGAMELGHKESLAIDIFDKVIEPFAGYGFNKSHAACYARIAYETAYLKAHYPTEFMTALMSADSGNTDKIVLEIGECTQMGINVLPPDVNESLYNFTVVEDGKIRFGLSAIKGLGEASARQIIEARGDNTFNNIEEFAKTVPAKLLNKKTIEALAFSGAMGTLGERNQIGLNVEAIADFGKSAETTVAEGQVGLFDDLGDDAGIPQDHLELNEVEPATPSQNLKWEKEYLGLYVSSHPLAGLSKWFAKKVIPTFDLPTKAVGKPIKVAGMIQMIRKITTKKGDMMAILKIEDTTGTVECVAFPATYNKIYETLVEDTIIEVEGILERRSGEMQVVIKKAEGITLEDLQEKAKKEGLFTAGEKVIKQTRADEELEEVQAAEEALGVNEKEVTQIGDLFKKNGDVHQIVISRTLDKDKLMELKTLFEAHPGDESVELIIGETVLPVPMKVAFNEEVTKGVDELLKSG